MAQSDLALRDGLLALRVRAGADGKEQGGNGWRSNSSQRRCIATLATQSGQTAQCDEPLAVAGIQSCIERATCVLRTGQAPDALMVLETFARALHSRGAWSRNRDRGILCEHLHGEVQVVTCPEPGPA